MIRSLHLPAHHILKVYGVALAGFSAELCALMYTVQMVSTTPYLSRLHPWSSSHSGQKYIPRTGEGLSSLPLPRSILRANWWPCSFNDLLQLTPIAPELSKLRLYPLG